MALRILRIAHLRGRPPGLAGGMSGARISHSWSERSLGYRHRDENIKGLQKPAMLLIKPHYLPSRTASSDSRRLERAEMRDLQKVNFHKSLYWPSSSFFCPSCSFFSSSCRCFSTCFLACLASSIFSIPILTPHPDPATTADSATQAALESMANLLFMLQTARLLSRYTVLFPPLSHPRWPGRTNGA